VLFNEPKLLKFSIRSSAFWRWRCFSALQRAEIAEIVPPIPSRLSRRRVSVLFNEPKLLKLLATYTVPHTRDGFSALQRAEIAEIFWSVSRAGGVLVRVVSVLFNEPKLLKFEPVWSSGVPLVVRFSALQRAEIAEILQSLVAQILALVFQCSSTSRNC